MCKISKIDEKRKNVQTIVRTVKALKSQNIAFSGYVGILIVSKRLELYVKLEQFGAKLHNWGNC